MIAELARTGRAASLRTARSGYRPVMAPSQPNDPTDAADAGGTPQPYDPIAEQEEARRARADRDRRLTSSERLQRLHDLCAQLATMTAARRRRRP